MPRFMDFHQDLKPPAEAIAQILDGTRHALADRFGVRRRYAALGVLCGDIH